MERTQTAVSSGAARGKPNKSYLLRRLWRYFRPYKWMLALAIVLTIVSNVLALIGPKLSGLAIDAIEPGVGRVDFATVFRYAGYMVVLYVASAAMSYLLQRLMIRLSRNVVYHMRKDLFDKLVSLPVGFLTGTRPATSSASCRTTWIRSMPRFRATSCRSLRASSPYWVRW